MGQGHTTDGVFVRGGNNPAYLLAVNSDGSINVNGATGATFTVSPPKTATATQSRVSVNNISTTLLAANGARGGAVIQNLGSSVLGISFSSPAVFASCVILLPQYGTLELGQPGIIYTGAVYGIRAAATDDAGVVEE